ncbi:hypothetical protein PHISP_03190 [Aspergillus sp. HF37]|nr:hypothetical protein PHISP_03190 [Aspergillus sp. HF37]
MDTESHDIQSQYSHAMLDAPLPSAPIPIPAPNMTAQVPFIEPGSPPGIPGTSEHTEAMSEHQAPIPTETEAATTAPEMSESGTEMLPLLFSSDADTLVYIDPPSEPSSDMACPVSTVPHRIHSRSLLDTSSAYFQKLFQPTYQFRIVKRRGLAGRLPEGVKYVIDLTPPTVEDEAVIFITELSCPLGVRSWASKRQRWDLPPTCVGGLDEFEPTECNGNSHEDRLDRKASVAGDKVGEGNTRPTCSEGTTGHGKTGTVKSKPAKKPKLPVEYSASRHRRGIEQILHVLEGFEVKLNTPCKVWTFFALANIFEVATTPRICDRILPWFYETTNTRFIELHPEVSYRVACGIKCSSLCQVAFSILVSEDTMLLLSKTGKPTDLARPTKTFHGRVRDTLDDTVLQRIEYASKSFMDYVVDRFIYLAGAEMPWLAELEEYHKVLGYPVKSANHDMIICKFISTLKDFVRGYIYSSIYRDPGTWLWKRYPPAADDDDYPPKSFKSCYTDMRYIERLMSRDFWARVQHGTFHADWPRLCPEIPHWSIADLGNLPAFQDQGDARIMFVARYELEEKAKDFNDLVPQSSDPTDGTGEQGPYLDLDELLSQIQCYVSDYARKMGQPPQSREMPLELTNTVACLTENEYKFLPLWAGGNDDGSGGVFTDHSIPIPEAGAFSAPILAADPGSPTLSDSSYAIMTKSECESSVEGASHRATESHQTDEALSMASIISSLHNDVEGNDANYGAALASWQTEDDAPSPLPGDSDNELGLAVSRDSNTVGERESISDFLSDNDALELGLDDGSDGGHEGFGSD